MDESDSLVRLIGSDEPLAPSYQQLFARPASENFFQSRAWFDNLRRHAAPAGDRVRLYAVEAADGNPLALIPGVYSRLYETHPRARVLHFLHPDGSNYLPLLAPGSENPLRVVELVLQSLYSDRRAYDVLRFSPLGRGSAFADGLSNMLRRNAHPLEIYRFSDDCYATTTPGSAASYLAARPPSLCATLELASQTLRAAGRIRFRLVRLPEEVDAGLRDYRKVLEQFGTEPASESADYLPGIVRAAAECGALRLGFIDLDGAPVAAQFWILSAGTARCLRILSTEHVIDIPLTDILIQDLAAQFIEDDRVAEMAFGAIDLRLATNWATGRRERIGLAAFNPRTWRGLKGAARHVGARYIKSLFRRG